MVFAYAADITSTTTDQDIVATTMDAEAERQQHLDWKKKKNKVVGRSSSFGLVESMLYLGNIIGPLVAAQFAVGNSRSLLIRGLLLECGIAIILLAYLIIYLPESLNYQMKYSKNKYKDYKSLTTTTSTNKASFLEEEVVEEVVKEEEESHVQPSQILFDSTTLSSSSSSSIITTTPPPSPLPPMTTGASLRRNNIFSSLLFLFWNGGTRRR